MQSPARLLSEADIHEFQTLVAEHAGASLTHEQADALAHQLLRVLYIIRDVAERGSTDSTSTVDQPALSKSDSHAENTFSSH